jgi:2-keto-4-pentenoate hydratase/2-oxohepta-3-ene-1,7-dioic acid hydratase in catechol pathway
VKLCRFELIASPGHARSGIVYGAKVYETEGSEGVAVHEWTDARLLAPIGQPPSVRFFSPPPEDSRWELGPDQALPVFEYLNPVGLIAPGLALPLQDGMALGADPCVGIVIAGAGRNVPVGEADGLVLGLTLVTAFRAQGESGARLRDVGFALGPAITTPDELDDAVTEDERGRRYRFPIALKVNSEVVVEFDLSALPYTLAELLSHASESCPVHIGDIVAVSLGSNSQILGKGDQVQSVSEKLGALTTRIA